MSEPSLLATAFAGSCPRCGESGLFSGWVQFSERCRACGLHHAAFNVGDGPAAFLILIVGALLTVGAVVLDQISSPPWWVHLLWLPLALALTVYGLRVGKALLLAQEYRHRAREGRIAE